LGEGKLLAGDDMMIIELPWHYTYPIYTGVLALALVILVPRKEIKRLFIYGVVFGGVANALLVSLIGNLLGAGGHTNYGLLGAFGVPFLPPIAWSAWFIMYLYFLPERKPWIVGYIVIAAVYAVFFSNVLINFHVFQLNYGVVLVPFVVYASWFAAATWAYFRSELRK